MGTDTNSGSSIYQYPSSGAASSGAIGGTQQLANAGTASQGLYNTALGSNAGLTTGTNYSNQQGVDSGNAITQNTQSQGLGGLASSALATGFNQNNALYNQELGQINDQTNSGLAARGLAMSPYAAGVQGQTDTNFNNTWNNQLLQNESTAAGTASTLDNTYNSGMSTGAQVSQGAADNSLSSLSSLLSSGNLSSSQLQSAIGDYLSYLTGGTSASSAQASAQNQAAQIDNQGLAGLGSLGGSLLGLGTGTNNSTIGGGLLSSLGL